ncbi:MAG: PilZ domain-containing protein [Sphingomicrobium sp.]
MYLETHIAADRLQRVTSRAHASIAEALSEATAKATARLGATVTPIISELPESVAAAEGERRRSDRFASSAPIHARRIPGTNFEVPLDNISSGGCRIETLEECEEGDDIIARLPHLEPIGARVRWTLGRTAGLQFVRPIHAAVFNRLLGQLHEDQPGA